MDTLDMAKALKDSMQPKPVTGNESTKTTTVFGTARGDSKDGLVDVDLGGDTISSRGTAYASIPTNVAVKSGDTVMVQLVGADGTGKQPVVVGVQGGGDSAEVNTSDAIKNAEEASKKADDAIIKADDAARKADSVKDTADSAEKKATEAKKESENASAKADNANEKAEQASNMADDGRKYADNYISFDKETGLIIGNQADIESGCSTHITSDKVAIYSGNEEVSSFESDKIHLAKNQRVYNNNARLPRIWSGTSVIGGLSSARQNIGFGKLSQLTGGQYDGVCVISCQNGDYNAFGGHIVATAMNADTHWVEAIFDRNVTVGAVRINWVITEVFV